MFADINAYLGLWPYRLVPETTAAAYEKRCTEEGIDRALVSSIDALFREDPADANRQLIEAVAGSKVLIPVAVLNPVLASWSVELLDYIAAKSIAAVKIHPNFHGYHMKFGPLSELAEELAGGGLPLLLPVRMEDERFQNPQMQVPPVSIQEIVEFEGKHPKLQIVCLNAYRKEVVVALELGAPDNLSFDIAFVDWFKPVDDMVRMLPDKRILFGTNSPLFVPRAAVMKVAYAEISDKSRKRIAGGNAAMYINTT